MWLAFAVVISLLLLFLAEFFRHKGLHAELSRKFVHVTVGSFVAFWPFFLSWRQIQLLGLVLLVLAVISVKMNLFRSVHGVDRSAAGEIMAVAIVPFLAYITTDEWIFMAAMLILSIADGLAAIVGLLWGDGNTYKVFGHTRSVAGSLAFFFAAIAVMIVYAAYSGASYNSTTVLWLPLAATIAENISIKGADNVVIPLLVALTLMTVA